MSRLAAIRARRAEVLHEAEATRAAACTAARRAIGGAREWTAPMSLGIAAGQALAGRGWVRAAALVSVALVLLRRWRGA